MSNISKTEDYKAFITEIKDKVQQAQLKAHIKVNEQMLRLYWDLAQGIIQKQKASQWGDGVVEQIASDLKRAFPRLKGFSITNIRYMKQWFIFWSQDGELNLPQPVGELEQVEKLPQPVGEIFEVPWGHNREIVSKCKSSNEALFYVRGTIEFGWSRSVLLHQIESGLYEREGKAISNFKRTLPAPDSDLAQATTKDPYNFDFLELTKEHNERELENALIEHVTKFLLELGSGFAYMGRQVPLKVGDSDFYLDLLFYHAKLHRYVVVELKTVKFVPEFAGKLNFYLSAVDDLIREDGDGPTVGILICKDKDKTVVEYALKDIDKPIGVSEYMITKSLPEEWEGKLPSIEELEDEIEGGE